MEFLSKKNKERMNSFSLYHILKQVHKLTYYYFVIITLFVRSTSNNTNSIHQMTIW